MTILLSICIPTLNRCEYLCKALSSIFSAEWDTTKVEVCISNNASELDYSDVDSLIACAPKGLRIKYISQASRLSIDEHMLAVKSMAQGEYIYFLGDDDFFVSSQLPLLIDLISNQSPDLAIFNGALIDENNKIIGSHFRVGPCTFTDSKEAFRFLRDKGSYGAILVKAVHLKDFYFRVLFGTSHAYGCYWFSLLSTDLMGKKVNIVVPNFPLVCLRVSEKLYKHTEVYYRDIPYEISIYKRYLPQGEAQKLNDLFLDRYIKSVSSLRFLMMLDYYGSRLEDIVDVNYSLYTKLAARIALARALNRLNVYGIARGIYKVVKARI